MPGVSVIVSGRDAASTVGRLLDALECQAGAPEFEVVFVDNGSLDGTPEIVAAHRVGARLVRRPRGQGPGAGRNTGVTVARGAILAFTDADCEPAPGWLAAGVGALADADLAQGAVKPQEGAALGPFDRTLWVCSEYGLYETASLFVKRHIFERVEGFPDPQPRDADERPFGEDVEFAWMARRDGARTTFVPDALVYHAVFHRGGRAFVREAWRRRFFPDLIRRAPELRETFCFGRMFLSPRTAAFDLAVVGAATAAPLAVLGIAPLTLALLVPYAAFVGQDVWRWRSGRRRPLAVAAIGMAADAVSLAALMRGSLRARTPLL